MKAAVESGSKAAVDDLGEFTDKSIRLVANLTTTASATANASAKAGGDIVRAVDTQITTAGGGVVSAQRAAVLSALTEARANLPATITASAGGAWRHTSAWAGTEPATSSTAPQHAVRAQPGRAASGPPAPAPREAPAPNWAASVDPSSASVAVRPPATTLATWSKYPAPTSRW